MKKLLTLAVAVMALAGCNIPQNDVLEFDPDYNRLARNVAIVEKTSNYVVYEYKNIRVDELAAIAALYCQEHGNKQAVLHDIQLTPGNARRATFYCRPQQLN